MSAFSLPQEVWDHVLHFVGESTDSERDLRACALVNTAWTRRSQKFLFKVVLIHGDTEWRRLHTLLCYTAPHLRRCVRELEINRTTANANAGALNWTDLLPVATHIYLLCSPPDIAFMSQLPSLRHLRVALVGHYNVGEGGSDRFLWESWQRFNLVGGPSKSRSSQQLERVTFEGDAVVPVQLLVLLWVVSWTATVRAQSLRRVNLALTSDMGPRYVEDFLKINKAITDLGLSLSCETGSSQINASVLRLDVRAHLSGVRLVLDFLRTTALPSLRKLDVTFIGFAKLPATNDEAHWIYFDPFEDVATGGTSDHEEEAIAAALATQLHEVTVTFARIKVLYHAQRFLKLFHEVSILNKLRIRHEPNFNEENGAKP